MIIANANSTSSRQIAQLSSNPGVVTEDLVLHLDAGQTDSYPGSGVVWKDISGNGYNGRIENGTSYDGDEGSFVFDGSDDYIDLSVYVSNLIFDSPASIDFWFKPALDKNTAGVIFSVGNGLDIYNTDSFVISNGNWTGALTGETISVHKFTDGLTNPSEISSRSIDVGTSVDYQNTWTCVTVIVESNTFKVYVNGIEKTLSSGYGTGTSFTYGENISPEIFAYLGARNVSSGPTTNLNGSISNFRLYSKALNEEEVTQNYNALKSRFGL
jgi:hypothetical protein